MGKISIVILIILAILPLHTQEIISDIDESKILPSETINEGNLPIEDLSKDEINAIAETVARSERSFLKGMWQGCLSVGFTSAVVAGLTYRIIPIFVTYPVVSGLMCIGTSILQYRQEYQVPMKYILHESDYSKNAVNRKYTEILRPQYVRGNIIGGVIGTGVLGLAGIVYFGIMWSMAMSGI